MPFAVYIADLLMQRLNVSLDCLRLGALRTHVVRRWLVLLFGYSLLRILSLLDVVFDIFFCMGSRLVWLFGGGGECHCEKSRREGRREQQTKCGLGMGIWGFHWCGFA